MKKCMWSKSINYLMNDAGVNFKKANEMLESTGYSKEQWNRLPTKLVVTLLDNMFRK